MIYKYFTRKSLFLKDSAEIHPKSLTLKDLDRGGVETSSSGIRFGEGFQSSALDPTSAMLLLLLYCRRFWVGRGRARGFLLSALTARFLSSGFAIGHVAEHLY